MAVGNMGRNKKGNGSLAVEVDMDEMVQAKREVQEVEEVVRYPECKFHLIRDGRQVACAVELKGPVTCLKV